MKSIKLVVGLGNPGPDYAGTRHNLGFVLVDMLASLRGLSWKGHTMAALIAKGHADGLILLKPQAYMNNSGQAAALLARENNISPEQILVISDDISIPLGALRLRANGSSGGHNGLESIINHLGSQEFPRLRLGVGPLPVGVDAADFVLARFSKQERSEVDKMMSVAMDALAMMLEHGFDKAASKLSAEKK